RKELVTMFQRVTIIGNLGQDPETRALPSGDLVCNFSVATNRKWTNQNGTQGEETAWWRVSAWGRTGEICQQYLSKGRQVYVEGTLLTDQNTGGPRIWTDQSGQPRASFEIRATNVWFLGGRDDNTGYDSGYEQNTNYARSTTSPAPAQQRSAATPQDRPAQQRPASQERDRRSTMSEPAPSADDFDDEDRFGAEEIPF
ncbi:MAG: single-stranded DNA-binding protein, partial [Ardenticatenaceae bacterium]